MELDKVKVGLRVKITQLGDTKGIYVKPKHLKCRKLGVTGTVLNYVPGHGGDVWWVEHDKDSQVGAYAFDEFEEVKDIENRSAWQKELPAEEGMWWAYGWWYGPKKDKEPMLYFVRVSKTASNYIFLQVDGVFLPRPKSTCVVWQKVKQPEPPKDFVYPKQLKEDTCSRSPTVSSQYGSSCTYRKN